MLHVIRLQYGQEIAATCLCHPYLAEDPDMAYVFALGVRPAWRRRGVALALLLHSFHEIYGYGRRRVALSVDAESPTGAARLYEKAQDNTVNALKSAQANHQRAIEDLIDSVFP